MSKEQEYQILKEEATIAVDEVVTMEIRGGILSFKDNNTGAVVEMNEEDFAEADLAYLMLRLEQRFPSMKTGVDNTEEEG